MEIGIGEAQRKATKSDRQLSSCWRSEWPFETERKKQKKKKGKRKKISFTAKSDRCTKMDLAQKASSTCLVPQNGRSVIPGRPNKASSHGRFSVYLEKKKEKYIYNPENEKKSITEITREGGGTIVTTTIHCFGASISFGFGQPAEDSAKQGKNSSVLRDKNGRNATCTKKMMEQVIDGSQLASILHPSFLFPPRKMANEVRIPFISCYADPPTADLDRHS
jgi:hypothetical protein